MHPVRWLRRLSGLTQAELARVAGTSQATVAAYESGRKSPTLRTLARLARSVGFEHWVSFHPPMTREDRRSLLLHDAIATKLIESPDGVLTLARANLALMSERHPGARPLLVEWDIILRRPIPGIVEAMIDPGTHARELRQVTPFAGVLTSRERAAIYTRFARRKANAA